ncbi:MAG: radical SAM protein [Candidatus Omnitrophica bacterium]|nr:radical SAM protein [Candidatus Omnitrophota bacterium]
MVVTSPPLGLGYIAAYLKRQHKWIDLKIIDEVVVFLSNEMLESEIIKAQGPVIVGISCLTATFSRAKELAGKIKAKRKDAVVVFGGVHVTAMPEESLATGFVDIVVRHEGEITMSEICEAVLKKSAIDDIKGISYLKNGEYHQTLNRQPISLDILPKFPYELFEENIKSYFDLGLVVTSRGCPFDCIFCLNRLVTGRVYRAFNADTVIDQIDTLVNKYGQRNILFADDNIVSDKKRFFKLLDTIIERGFHKKAFFLAQLRADEITEDVLEAMKKANFKMISCGIETASQRLLDFINKSESIEEMKKGVRLAHSKGFLTGATFIYGLPSETKDDRRLSAKLSRELPLDSARFNIATPYPGTRLNEIARSENRLTISHEWKNFNVQYYMFGDDIPYVPASVGRFTLMFDTMWANLRFYLRFKILLTTFFKADITGGGVISRQNKRNFFVLCWKAVQIAFLIMARFVYLRVMSLAEKFKK